MLLPDKPEALMSPFLTNYRKDMTKILGMMNVQHLWSQRNVLLYKTVELVFSSVHFSDFKWVFTQDFCRFTKNLSKFQKFQVNLRTFQNIFFKFQDFQGMYDPCKTPKITCWKSLAGFLVLKTCFVSILEQVNYQFGIAK